MGVFVTIEGPNGVGKSTFIQKLLEMYSEDDIFLTREPSESKFGEYVKHNEDDLSGDSYAYLIAADRCYHVSKFIEPELKKRKIVISDRYVESSFVLQTSDGVSFEDVWRLNCKFPVPDISVILTCSPQEIEKRLSQRNILTRYEKKLTRKEEIKGYEKAVEFLSLKGYHFVKYENDTKEMQTKNIRELFGIIESIRKVKNDR